MERVSPVSLLVVCTGNASRSVLAGLMLQHLAARHSLDVSVATAGTHAVDGLPLGARTLAAWRSVPELASEADGGLASTGLVAPGHRSHQLSAEDLRNGTALVVVMEAGHVRYMRRYHPEAAARTAMLRWLVRNLVPGSAPLADLATRVAALDLEHVDVDPRDDVADPAGRDDASYDACAAELWVLCKALVPRL